MLLACRLAVSGQVRLYVRLLPGPASPKIEWHQGGVPLGALWGSQSTGLRNPAMDSWRNGKIHISIQ